MVTDSHGKSVDGKKRCVCVRSSWRETFSTYAARWDAESVLLIVEFLLECLQLLVDSYLKVWRVLALTQECASCGVRL